MRAYSTDLRERVLAALDRGMARSEVVTTFGISLATLKRWAARKRAGITLTPGRSPGRPYRLTTDDLVQLRERVLAAPDATLDAHLAWWNAQHPKRPLSRATIDRAIARLNWTRKKSRSGLANKTL